MTVGWTLMSTGPMPAPREIGLPGNHFEAHIEVRSGHCRWAQTERHGGHECPPYGEPDEFF